METTDSFIHSRSFLENHTRFQAKMGEVYTCFQTKTAQKPYPWLPKVRKWSGRIISSRSGNSTSSQGKFKSLKEVREKWNFKGIHLYIFTEMIDVVLVEYCSFQLNNRLMLGFLKRAILFAHYFKKLSISIGNSMICRDVWHKCHEWYFKIVIRNFTSR